MKKILYCFISDENGKFLRAVQQVNGDWLVTRSMSPYPILHNPSNIVDSPVEFGTNSKYFSLNRSISYPLEFIKDGAAILRELYYLGKGAKQKAYLTIIEWNGGSSSYDYDLSYFGKIEFKEKKEDPKSGRFTVPTVDDSAWGVLSQNDTVQYSVDCSATNPKAIRVVFDGITLVSRYTFQTVQSSMVHSGTVDNSYTIPFVLVNTDGDSVGIITNNQTFNDASAIFPAGWFFSSIYPLASTSIEGEIMFEWDCTGPYTPSRIDFTLRTSQTTSYSLFSSFGVTLVKGKIYKSSFNFNLAALDPVENLFLEMRVLGQVADTAHPIVVTPIVTNISFITRTTPQTVVAYGLRPLDLLQELVFKATKGKYTINSNFLTINNNDIIFGGDSLRGLSNAKIYSSFADFFQTFGGVYFIALRNILGQLWLEEATTVYDPTNTIIDLGDCSDCELVPAVEYLANEIEAGSPKQDLRHPSGRLEFNTQNTFSTPITEESKKISYVTKYRTGCFDIQFLIVDYKGGSTVDNTGDKSVYMARITNQTITAIDDVETFENVTIDNALLEPLIKYPLNNDVITFDKPSLSGVAPALTSVNIYVDGTLDGGTVSDASGNWSYDIVTPLSEFIPSVQTGIHLIEASLTDLSAPVSSVTVTIDTSYGTVTNLIYPDNTDTLYNDLPLIKGVAQQGTSVAISLDGTLIGTVIADGSCRFFFKTVVPMSDGAHVLTANGDTSSFTVDSNVSHPLITYVCSELDGFAIVNNLPLIKGVAQPGTLVTLWLNYISYAPLGSVLADANGDWSFQVVPVNYIDVVTHLPVVLAPIQNGLNIISTSLTNYTVPINVLGYKLERPAFSVIEGVTDNTVFNTWYTPKRSILMHSPYLSSVLNRQTNEKIIFETGDKNSQFKTVLAGVTVDEDADIPISSLGNPMFLLEIAKIKTKSLNTFIKTLENFNSGGLVKTTYRGTEIFMLPIGNMKMKSVTHDIQEWSLLISPLTSYRSLLSLYKNGLTINLMKNSLYHSDYNTLHFVVYNKADNPLYNFKGRYDDWFCNRNGAWLLNPRYTQKLQRNEVFVDQIITSGLTSLFLNVYRCSNNTLVTSIPYLPVTPAVIPAPDIVVEAAVNLSGYPEGVYFFVLTSVAYPTLITIPYQASTTDNNFIFTLDGVPTVGDTVTVNYYVNGSTIPDIVVSTVLSGWTISDIIDDVLAQVSADSNFIYAGYETVGGRIGVRVETTNTLYGFVSTTSLTATNTDLAISERIETKDKWLGTIRIEATNAINLTGAYFSTGFKTILRVEGLVKKLQPDLSFIVAKDESGDSEMLYSNPAKKRTIRFGTAYGLPDYLYLKVASALGTDGLFIEGVGYTLQPDAKIEPADEVDGHPLYYYNVDMALRINETGLTLAVDDTLPTQGAVLVIDATAFGLPAGSIINIQLDNA